MENFFMDKRCISALTSMYKAKPHKHLMLQLFMNYNEKCHIAIEDKIISGNCILVDKNITHNILKDNKKGFIMLMDPMCLVAKQLERDYLGNIGYSILEINNMYEELKYFHENPCVENNIKFQEFIFQQLNIDYNAEMQYEKRIKEMIQMCENDKECKYSLEEISDHLYLSKSRLAHLFKKETGVPLKSYIQLCRLKKVYTLLMEGRNITDAAMLSGFYSPSHLSWQNKKITGLSVSEILRAIV